MKREKESVNGFSRNPMHKSFLIIFFLLSTVLGGCGASKSSTTGGDFLFDLPGKYSLTDMTSDRCSLMQDDLLLCGIVITDLNPDRIADTDNIALRQYLETFAPLPLTYEYISMYCDTDDRTYTNITFRVNDPETGSSSNYHHYLFKKGDKCYDLWIDDACMDEEEQRAFVRSVIPKK